MTTPCAACESPTDATLCARCTHTLEKTIAEMPAWLTELDVTISRQDRGTGTPLYAVALARVQQPGVDYPEGKLTLPSTPWPFAWDAANLRWTVEATMQAWAAPYMANRPAGPTCQRCTHETCVRMRPANPSLVLVTRIREIRRSPDAGQMLDELTWAKSQIQRAVDRQTPDIFAGVCDAPDVRIERLHLAGPVCQPFTCHHDTCRELRERPLRVATRIGRCGTDLYAHEGDDSVKCSTCGQTYQLDQRRRDLVDMLPDVIAPTTAIANALTTLQQSVTSSMIRQMAHRGEIASRGTDPTDPRGRLYRVGDVLDVLAARALRKPRKASDRRRKVAS